MPEKTFYNHGKETVTDEMEEYYKDQKRKYEEWKKFHGY